jgi:CheY-like chemotaxis protein
VLEQRRHDRKLRATPTIVMSALAADWVGACGADAQLEKPIDVEQLTTVLRRFLPIPRSSDVRSILVVDDDDDTRAAIAEVLEDQGYLVTLATNGHEAELKLHDIERPDCIVVDLWMPVMNGWTFITRLQRFGPRPIPILVLTAAEPHWGYPVPRTNVLRKPFRPESLISMLQRLQPDPGAATEPEEPEGAARARSDRADR